MSDPDLPELSAFLDGELDAAHARGVEALIAADPAVHAAFEQLKSADQRLRVISDVAGFQPEVHWPPFVTRRAEPWIAFPMLLILIAWIIGKLATAMTTAVAVNLAALLLFIACLTLLALSERRASDTFVLDLAS